ncbi:MAG: biopolymer transporter ExbD [Planctomycetes bacterium]|nr:biopolymer transporter ExbD [Planctomycetota bacterium]
MIKKKAKKFEEVKADMAPMIDVTFLLLIFFIVTLKFKVLEGRLDAALPKDMGTQTTQTEEIEKVDIVLTVRNPGTLIKDIATKTTSYPLGRLEKYSGRVVQYQLGSSKFTDLNKLSDHLSGFAKTEEDKKDTPVTIDPRKGTVYGDVVGVLDVVIDKGFQKISFAGSHEEE